MEFDDVVSQLCDNLKRKLLFIPQEIKQRCEEIRLRAGLPVCLTVDTKVNFVCQNSAVCDVLTKNVLVASHQDLQQTLSLLCKQSIYLHENEIKKGFISLSGGGRAGVCGFFNAEGMLVSVSSINIRIARQVFDCARNFLPYSHDGLLIAGPPGCGKTTVLRDLIRMLSNGEGGRYYRVSVIDSRGEISGGGALDLGVNTDVFNMESKRKGTEIALRTMYPDFIAFDELGNPDELDGISNCFNAGVRIITTVHCRDASDLLRREIIKKFLKMNVVSNVVLLSHNAGKESKIISIGELKNVCT